MARRRPAYLIQRDADNAKAREAYLARPKPAPTGAIASRPRKSYGYRSLLVIDEGEHLLFSIKASRNAVTKLGTGPLGITDPPAVDAEEAPDNFTPSLVLLTVGDTTPQRVNTEYGTGYIRYYAGTTGDTQSHYRAPISRPTGTFNADDLVAQRAALRTAAGAVQNTHMYLQFERSNVTLL